MPIADSTQEPQTVKLHLTSSVELIRACLRPYSMDCGNLGVPESETVPLEVDCNPGDADR